MNNTGRKVAKGSKTSAPMVMTSTSAAKPSTTTVASATTVSARPTRDQIARRSYEIFLARGGTSGHDVEDWIRAERDLST